MLGLADKALSSLALITGALALKTRALDFLTGALALITKALALINGSFALITRALAYIAYITRGLAVIMGAVAFSFAHK